MKELDKMDELFAKSFASFEVTPPPLVKENIDHKIGFILPFWIYCFGLLMFFGTFVFLRLDFQKSNTENIYYSKSDSAKQLENTLALTKSKGVNETRNKVVNSSDGQSPYEFKVNESTKFSNVEIPKFTLKSKIRLSGSTLQNDKSHHVENSQGISLNNSHKNSVESLINTGLTVKSSRSEEMTERNTEFDESFKDSSILVENFSNNSNVSILTNTGSSDSINKKKPEIDEPNSEDKWLIGLSYGARYSRIKPAHEVHIGTINSAEYAFYGLRKLPENAIFDYAGLQCTYFQALNHNRHQIFDPITNNSHEDTTASHIRQYSFGMMSQYNYFFWKGLGFSFDQSIRYVLTNYKVDGHSEDFDSKNFNIGLGLDLCYDYRFLRFNAGIHSSMDLRFNSEEFLFREKMRLNLIPQVGIAVKF